MDIIKDKIKLLYQEKGSSVYNYCADFIKHEINNNRSENILATTIDSIVKGSFYFILYDLNGKSSKMEQYNPILAVDFVNRSLYGLSLNFIPVNIRVTLFNKIYSKLDTLKKNADLDIENQQPLPNTNYNTIYNILKSIGFEYAIRTFDLSLINKVYQISTNILPEFIAMNTQTFTGVDEGKLVDIWLKKINEQEQREQELMKELLSDFTKIEAEIDKYNK